MTGFLYSSESFALAGIERYWEYWENRISNTDPTHSQVVRRTARSTSRMRMPMDARTPARCRRVSGKVDAMRPAQGDSTMRTA